MYFINPFKGLRPTKENASSVAVSSTDHLSKDSVVDHKNNNSWSYLNVFGEKKTILFNLCGHGHFDMQAYGDYFNNKLSDDKYNESDANKALEKLPKIA